MNDELAMKELITLIALSQDVLRDLMMEAKSNDPELMAIYCHALRVLGELLEDTIVAIAICCGYYLNKCEGTD